MTKKQTRVRRQIFVLTPEEKKAVACVLGALLLGLATQHYRATHPRPPPPLTAKQQYAAERAARAATARSRSARGQAAAAAVAAAGRVTPTPGDSQEIVEDQD